MKPFEKVKAVYERVKNAVRSRTSDAEWHEIRHIAFMEISGCVLGLCILALHGFSAKYLHKETGLHFFDHVSSIDSEFMLTGPAATGLLLIFSGWFLEKTAYKLVVKPWIGLVTHSLALFAGVSIPVGIADAVSKSVMHGLGLFIVVFVSGNLLAALFGLLGIGANPEPSTQNGAVDGLFKHKFARFVIGVGCVAAYLLT